MAKIDYKKLRNELIKRTSRYADGIDELYDMALDSIAREFVSLDYDPDEPFSFEEYRKFNSVDDIMCHLESQIQSLVDKGIANEFGEAYKGCNELVKQVVGKRINEELLMAFSPKIASGIAAKAFIKEFSAGAMKPSQRVWNGAVLGQMETAVQEALMDGMPAKKMAKLLKDYLVEPESCFRRFRIKTGVDSDGKNMYGRKWMKRVIHDDGTVTWKNADPRDYPTGQGVYHSSYKNALRYARTTTNMAYRTADHVRYQELPFVIGIDIHVSNNPAHIKDICDELQGRYPKAFKWTGWHPNCMCYQVPVLASVKEVNEMADAIQDGRDPDDVQCRGEVTELPENFVKWMQDNADRYLEATNRNTIPYFLKDNFRFASAALNNSISIDDIIESKVIELSTSERKSIIKDVRELRKTAYLFTDVDIHISIEPLPLGRMMTYDNGRLLISNNEFTFSDNEKYCPAKALQSAFLKLKRKEELNFYEEYSLESLFHESVHSRINHSWGGEMDSKIYEICTQLYARENYSSILSTFGVQAVNQDEIRKNGLGYNNGCNLLRKFFTKDNIVDSQKIMTVLLSNNSYSAFVNIATELGVSSAELRQLFKNLL